MIRTRWAIIVWIAILAVISLRVVVSSRSHSVYPIFRTAGQHWLAGETVYVPPTDELDVFRYSPSVAAFFAPWSLAHDRSAEIGWRLLNAFVFLAALVVWSRFWLSRAQVPAVLLLVIPLTIGGLNNGQCNALVAGLLLFAHVAFARDRWTTAAALIAAATLVKGYPLALGLLFCIIEPRQFTPRLLACVVIGIALPYLCQRPEYVTGQYADYFERLVADNRTHFNLDAGYHDLHMLIRRVGIPLSLAGYRVGELLLGCAVAVLNWTARRRGDERHTLIRNCLALAMCWMTLAGPATESSTYVLLAPILAYALLTIRDQPTWQSWCVFGSFAFFAIAAMAVWFPGWISRPVHATGIQPFAALLLAISVVADALRNRASHGFVRRSRAVASNNFAA